MIGFFYNPTSLQPLAFDSYKGDKEKVSSILTQTFGVTSHQASRAATIICKTAKEISSTQPKEWRIKLKEVVKNTGLEVVLNEDLFAAMDLQHTLSELGKTIVGTWVTTSRRGDPYQWSFTEQHFDFRANGEFEYIKVKTLYNRLTNVTDREGGAGIYLACNDSEFVLFWDSGFMWTSTLSGGLLRIEGENYGREEN